MTIWKNGGKHYFCWATLPLPQALNSAFHQTMILFIVKDRKKRSLLRKKSPLHQIIYRLESYFCFTSQINNKCSRKNGLSRYIKWKKKMLLSFKQGKVIHRTMTSSKSKASLAHLLSADASCGMKSSKAPGDKRSPTTTSSHKWERVSNILVPKEHSDYDRPTAFQQRCLQTTAGARQEYSVLIPWNLTKGKQSILCPMQWG